MSSSPIFSRSSATYRRPHQASTSVSPPGPPTPPVDASPNPRPIAQLLAFVVVVFLGLLQFLPATHFRHPSDPLRKWVPFDSGSPVSSSFSRSVASEDGKIHIVSWMDCLDLRVLVVLANSTLSNSRYPDKVHFHFFIPEGHDDKVSYFKLKVLFPHSDLEIFGQEEVKEKVRTANSGIVYAGRSFEEIVPFVIPTIHRSWGKFIYISPNVIVKGRVEELLEANLTSYAVAVIEDCSKRLDNYVNSEVLAAIQRTASKSWISGTPYAMKACMPDSSILLIDPRKLDKDLVEAILWWSKVLNWSERSSPKNPAIALALHGRYSKLSSSWLLGHSRRGTGKEIMIIPYDGPTNMCSGFGNGPSQSVPGNIWKQYLPPMADRILGS
ncbi:hypothetical protein VitviT2T_015880 [Vitis vinifera]|uniref:Hexosyltransferase n=2 Tax=Vitis vinifera TaxID=29760 RepID=A0ABY9CQ08_VITVI